MLELFLCGKQGVSFIRVNLIESTEKFKKKIVKQLIRKTKNLRKFFSKKRNQRRSLFLASTLVIFILSSLTLHFIKTNQAKALELHKQSQQLQQATEQKQQVEQVKTDLEVKVQTEYVPKVEHEQQIKQKDEEIEKIKVSKAAEKAELARQAQIRLASHRRQSTGGFGGGASTTVSYARGATAGNTYAYGNCTYYAKNRRPDLPNNLGNADTWVSRAARQGLPTGSTPRVGAIGQQGMHVVYIESVNGDGTVTLSEMNYVGYDQISSRRARASDFQYIY